MTLSRLPADELAKLSLESLLLALEAELLVLASEGWSASPALAADHLLLSAEDADGLALDGGRSFFKSSFICEINQLC